jgi:hypothetical protein
MGENLVTTMRRQRMAFVRTKRVSGREYFQLVENYRDEDGRHRQRVLAHLGQNPTVEAAIEDLARGERAEIERGWQMRPKTRARLENLRRLMAEGKAKPDPLGVRERREAERRKDLEEDRKFFEKLKAVLGG